MNKKAQELDVRNIMQGLEEFASFMSFQGNSSGLRILSVETVPQQKLSPVPIQSDRILSIEKRQQRAHKLKQQSFQKSLLFQDRSIH